MTDTFHRPSADHADYRSPPLEVRFDLQMPARVVIEVAGELDLATGEILRSAVAERLNSLAGESLPAEVVYRLPNLKFIDAAGLNALLGVARPTLQDVVIVEPSSAVRRLLGLIGLDGMIIEESNR